MRNAYRQHVGRQVVVHTEDATLVGTLAAASGDTLTVERAAILDPSRGDLGMDGVVLVPVFAVVWMQVT